MAWTGGGVEEGAGVEMETSKQIQEPWFGLWMVWWMAGWMGEWTASPLPPCYKVFFLETLNVPSV